MLHFIDHIPSGGSLFLKEIKKTLFLLKFAKDHNEVWLMLVVTCGPIFLL